MHNPWLSIWSSPRETIRHILQHNPRTGFWALATIYALTLSFSTANFYSWGLDRSFSKVFFPLFFLSPFTGFVWLMFQAFLLRLTGRWLGGKAPVWHVRAAVAWSRVPFVFALGMWVVLMGLRAETVFIQTTVYVSLVSTALHVWSIVLLVLLVREVQGFGGWRALANVMLAWFLSFVVVTTVAAIVRYIII